MKIIWKLWSGEAVINRSTSHIHDGISFDIIQEALWKIQSEDERYIDQTIYFDRSIGQSLRIATTDEDEIVFAKRKNRRWLSRFVKNKAPLDYNGLTLVLLKDKYHSNQYVLMTAYIGDKAPPEPRDNDVFDRIENGDLLKEQALEFWSKQALLRGYFELDN